MQINFKVKTLDAQTHDFSVDNEMTVREFKDLVASKTNIDPSQQRIIFCGRVLSDERQLKDFDVDGKVMHVAERPPPSAQAADQPARTNDSTAAAASAGGAHPRAARLPNNMRNSPLFRALDGMMNAGGPVPANGGPATTAASSSSSFCMNRITVATHMLDCANNVTAFLEDPRRGLHNPPMDILTRGRWTMESTVVEVGITPSELPQNQIVDMVQGAVTAAFRSNTNVTVLQLPSVFTMAGEAGGAAAGEGGDAGSGSGATTTAAAAVIIEEDPEGDEAGGGGGATGGQPGQPSNIAVVTLDVDRDVDLGGSGAGSASGDGLAGAAGGDAGSTRPPTQTTGTNTEDGQQRNRTGTRALAEVVAYMNRVQQRMAPFVEQYHELLRDDPPFEENDQEGRERAQRLFDRVSEALHYMSHAQHAISDLMLDMSQPQPRYLTCRPILVEQSGYVSSTNNVQVAHMRNNLRRAQQEVRDQAQRLRQQQDDLRYRQQQQDVLRDRMRHLQQQRGSRQGRSGSRLPNGGETPAAGGPDGGGSMTVPPAVVSAVASSVASAVASAVANAVAAAEPPGSQATAWQPGNANSTPTRAAAPESGRHIDVDVSPMSHSPMSQGSSSSVEDPIGDMLAGEMFAGGPTAATTGTATTTAGAGAPQTQESGQQTPASASAAGSTATATDGQPASAAPTPALNVHTQMHVARLIQAMMNSAPMDTEFHVQINSPNIVTIGLPRIPAQMPVPLGATAGPAGPAAPSEAPTPPAAGTEGTATASEPAAAGAGGDATTGRPPAAGPAPAGAAPGAAVGVDVAAGGPVPLHGRFVPTNGASSFDRFLPCNSHHISEPAANIPPQPGATPAPSGLRIHAVGSLAGTPYANLFAPELSAASRRRSLLLAPRADRAAGQRRVLAAAAVTRRRLELYLQIARFVFNRLFVGEPVSPAATGRALERARLWLAPYLYFLPQYERKEYDAAGSLHAVFRSGLASLVQAVQENRPWRQTDFEATVRRLFDGWRRQLFGTLCACVGREYAEIFWAQLMRQLSGAVPAHFGGDAKEFLQSRLSGDLPQPAAPEEIAHFVVRRDAAGRTEPMDHEASGSPGPHQSATAAAASQRDPSSNDSLMPSTADNSILDNNNTSTTEDNQRAPAADAPTAPTLTGTAATSSGTHPISDEAVTSTEDEPCRVTRATESVAEPTATPANTPVTGLAQQIVASEPATAQLGEEFGGDATPEPPAERLTFPKVEPGSQPWHQHMPADWLDCIQHDVQLQQETPPGRGPFSDSYISGMSSKRRKMVLAHKPPADIKKLISSSLMEAVLRVAPAPIINAATMAAGGAPGGSATGGASTSAAAAAAARQMGSGGGGPLGGNAQIRQAQANRLNQQICAAISEEAALRASVGERVRQHVGDRFKRQPDEKPDKFPKCAEFSKK